ncbi:hypothetical protein ACLK17_12550 [Escherichia coli]
MIKPVLRSSYRQYILSLWLPFYLGAADAGGRLCAGHCAERATGAGDAAGGANRAGVLAFVVMIVLSRHPLVVEVKRRVCRSEK